MVLAQQRVHRQHVLLPVVLRAQVLHVGQAHVPAELPLADHAHAPGLLGVDLRRTPQLLVPDGRIVRQRGQVGRPFRMALRTHDEHRGPERHVLVAGATQTLDELGRFPPAKRPQAAGEDDGLATKRLGPRGIEREL